jgi:hypothetical protein
VIIYFIKGAKDGTNERNWWIAIAIVIQMTTSFQSIGVSKVSLYGPDVRGFAQTVSN